MKGASTCTLPKNISRIKSLTKNQNAICINGRCSLPLTREISKIGIANKINRAADMPTTSPILEGILLKIT